MASKIINGGWHKNHDVQIEVGPMEAMESGKRYWAKVVGVMRGVMREQTDTTPSWMDVVGWPGQERWGETEAEAIHNVYDAAKKWIDEQEPSH